MSTKPDKSTLRLTRRGLLAGTLGSAAVSVLGASAQPDSDRGTDQSDLDRFEDNAAVAGIVEAWRAVPALDPPAWDPLSATWRYARGEKSEGLQAKIDQLPAGLEPIQLRHRVLEPDTPLWYQAKVTLATPCVVRVSADDGAHLFINGKRIPAVDQAFSIPRQPQTTCDLVVRVLNKAVYGGLMSVQSMETEAFVRHRDAAALRERLDRSIGKLRRIPTPHKGLLDAGQKAVKDPSLANIMALEAQLAKFPLITIGPVVHQQSPEVAIVAWETDVKTTPELAYRKVDGSAAHAVIASDGLFHQAKLTGLRADSVVTYQVKTKGIQTEVTKFTTLPTKPGFNFTVWADSHVGYRRFRQNVGAMLFEESAFTVGIGDLVVDAASKKPWEEFFDLGSPLFSTTPVFFTGGNHDYDDCFEDLNSQYFNRYARLDGKPYYAWTVANCRFVALDPNIQFPTGIDEGSDQHRWLMKELESQEWKSAEWRFIFIHQPPYGRGWTDYAGDLPIRELLDSAIPKHKVDFVVSGHIHDYERLTKDYSGHLCTFLVVGGAGGGLEDGPQNPHPQMDVVAVRHHYGRFSVEADRVLFEAFCTDTTLLDRYERKR